MIKAALFILLSLVALTFKLSEPAFYFSGDILEAIGHPGSTWGEARFQDRFDFDKFYSLYDSHVHFILNTSEDISFSSLVFTSFAFILLSSFFYFTKSNKSSENTIPALFAALIYLFLLNLSFENPLKFLAAALFPWAFYFLDKCREKSFKPLSLLFTFFLFFCVFIDFSFIILILYFLISEILLLFVKKERVYSIFPLTSLVLFGIIINIFPKTNLILEKIYLFFNNPHILTLNYYSFQTPNFHINHSLAIALCLLLALKALSGNSLEKKERVRLLVGFLFACQIKGAEFIFVFLVAKVIFDELRKTKFHPKFVFYSLAIVSVIFLSSFSVKRKFDSNARLKISSKMKDLLEELDKKENTKIFNPPNLAFILRDNSLKPFIDERMGAGFKEYREIARNPKDSDKLLGRLKPTHALLYKNSSLSSFLLESDKWQVVSESKELENDKIEFLGHDVSRDLILMEMR